MPQIYVRRPAGQVVFTEENQVLVSRSTAAKHQSIWIGVAETGIDGKLRAAKGSD